ncbi:BTB/POZ domain-containing protein [Colletotrichum musicola]|uniref:BTB/POZ domain-containing protein n=1 Tax=Colletotrichum musicola TaxID=2175873 RepID=A0A8H6KSB6_9PEZI|nr:BTB/POZ domain-containing protein [Colletotrichum musicola]
MVMVTYTETYRWLLETGKFSDFVIDCQGRRTAVHKIILCAHSQYFVSLFDSGLEGELQRFLGEREASLADDQVQEAEKGEVVFSDVDPEAMKHLLDYFYRGTAEWAAPLDDISLHADVWILAERLQATGAMLEVETRLLSHLEIMPKKQLVADKKLLTNVFSHPAIAQSAVGRIVSEAAWYVSARPYKYPEPAKTVRAAALESVGLANAMLDWSSDYAGVGDNYFADNIAALSSDCSTSDPLSKLLTPRYDNLLRLSGPAPPAGSRPGTRARPNKLLPVPFLRSLCLNEIRTPLISPKLTKLRSPGA